MKTYKGPCFELDLDDGWVPVEGGLSDALIVLERPGEDVQLSASGFLIDASGRDLDTFAQDVVSNTLAALQAAAHEAGAGALTVETFDQFGVPSGHEVEISGAIEGRGDFQMYMIIRSYLIVTLRIESFAFAPAALTALFDTVQLGLYVGEPAAPRR